MTGNCLGWLAYGYYTYDPFVVAANLPGLVLSLWLNMGAAKLQYLERAELPSSRRRTAKTTEPATIEGAGGGRTDLLRPPSAASSSSSSTRRHHRGFGGATTTGEEHWDATSPTEEDDAEEGEEERSGLMAIMTVGRRRGRSSLSRISGNDHDGGDGGEEEYLVMVPQERSLLRLLCLWSVVLIWVGWFSDRDPAVAIGLTVNLNLVWFYAAPLQKMRTVVVERTSDSIHFPTMVMNCLNTSFWIAYVYSRFDYSPRRGMFDER